MKYKNDRLRQIAEIRQLLRVYKLARFLRFLNCDLELTNTGICGTYSDYFGRDLNGKTNWLLHEAIEKATDYKCRYIFPSGQTKPRIKFLKTLLKELENDNK